MSKETQRLFLGLILAYLILVPSIQFNQFGISGIYNQKRYLELCLFLLLLILYASDKALVQRTSTLLLKFPRFVIYGFGLVLILGFFSALNSEYTTWAILDISHYLFIFILILITAAIFKNYPQEGIKFLQVAVIGIVSIYLLRVTISYVQFQLSYYPLWPGSERSVGKFGFADKRFFNHIQTWTLPVLISLGWYYWQNKKKNKARFFLATLIIGWQVLLIRSGGRGTSLGILLALIPIVFLIGKKKSRFLKYNASLLGLAILSYLIFFELLGSSSGPTILRSHSSGRIDEWINIIPPIFEHPILGFGPMHYAAVNLNNAWGHPHNWFLQVAYEWGIPVSLILLGIFGVGILKFAKRLRIETNQENKYWIKFGLMWSILASFIHSFFSGIIVTPLSQVWLILIVGCSIGLYFTGLNTQVNYVSGKIDKVVSLLIVIGLCGFIYWGINHELDREPIERSYLQETNSTVLHPRYWQQGKIGFKDNR